MRAATQLPPALTGPHLHVADDVSVRLLVEGLVSDPCAEGEGQGEVGDRVARQTDRPEGRQTGNG